VTRRVLGRAPRAPSIWRTPRRNSKRGAEESCPRSQGGGDFEKQGVVLGVQSFLETQKAEVQEMPIINLAKVQLRCVANPFAH
jgi:hypothetical protein